MIESTPILLHVPLPVGPRGSLAQARDLPLVRLTSGPAVAYGEAALDDPRVLPDVLDFFADVLAPADPRDFGLLWQRLAWTVRDYQPEPRRDYAAVLSALDIALWDLAGQFLDCPCWRLLGGARARRVDCYAAGLTAAAPDGLAATARDLRLRFGSVQLRLTGDLAADLAAARIVRQAVGEGTPLRVDAGGAYPDLDSAAELARGLEPLEVFSLQDPMPAGNWSDWARLREQAALGLGGGRCLTGPEAAAPALAAGAYDLLTPDPRLCGGITGGRRLADLVWAYGVGISFCGAFSPLGQLAAAHLTAATLHAGPIEVGGLATPLDEMLEPAPRFTDGFLLLPEGPGLGSRVSEGFVDRYQVGWTAP